MKTRKIIVCCDREDDVVSLMRYKETLTQNSGTSDACRFHLLERLGAQVEELEQQRKMIERGKIRVDDTVFQNCLMDYSSAELKELKESFEYQSFKKIRDLFGDLEVKDSARLEELKRLLNVEKKELSKTIENDSKKNVEFIICKKYDELKNIQKKNEYYGLVVPCELRWANEKGIFQNSDFMGITLVQHLREEGVAIPVVFTSVLGVKDIVKIRKDAGIVSTPALQHKIVDRFAGWETVVNAFDGMRLLNDTELKYTQLLYCSLEGMLKQIKHSIRSSSNKDEYREQIEYVLEQAFNNDHKLQEEFHKTDDLELFCEKLIKCLNNSDELNEKKDIAPDFLCSEEEEPIRIVYLEDNPDDENVANFIKFIDDRNKEVKKRNVEIDKRNREKEGKKKEKKEKYKFANPTIVNNVEALERCYKTHDVIIVDIDIRNDNNELVALGFEVMRHLIEDLKATSHAYYIVTNVTRSFYDQIKIPGIKHIRLKEEVFGTDDKIERFLYGIKEAVESKKAPASDCQSVFDMLDAYVNNGSNYPIHYKFNYMPEGKVLQCFEELEELVRSETQVLVNYFLSSCIKQRKEYSNQLEDGDCFDIFDDASKETQDYIGSNPGRLGKGNGKMVSTVMKRKNEVPSSAIVNAFIVRLILRRFFVYVREFVKYHHLKEIGEMLYGKDRGVSESDLACRAVNGTKGAYKGYEENESKQSKCLTETLMLTEDDNRIGSMLTDEEKEFIKYLVQQESVVFDFFSTQKTEKLKFDY
ncbi:MAG: hypothetical protein K5920_06635 [Bacteroidales bacterium]|nr:hypothetical protein [Bacteroidales bacterium]